MHDIVSIIGGGASVKQVDLTKLPGHVIGVNDAFCHAPCHMAFSMDRLWTENRWAALYHEGKPAMIRDAALKGIAERPSWLRIFEANIASFKPTANWQVLNGNNSGLCALQFVHCHMRNLREMLGKNVKLRVYLFGYDMTGEYWYPRYSWNEGNIKEGKLQTWSREFFPLARAFRDLGVEVFNVSGVSIIDVFKKIKPEEVHSLPCAI